MAKDEAIGIVRDEHMRSDQKAKKRKHSRRWGTITEDTSRINPRPVFKMCTDKKLWSALISRYETGALRLQSTVTTSFVQAQILQIYLEDPRSISSSESFCRTRVLKRASQFCRQQKGPWKNPFYQSVIRTSPSFKIAGAKSPRPQKRGSLHLELRAQPKKSIMEDDVGDGCIKRQGHSGLPGPPFPT